MINRCYNKNFPAYKNYGARGIKVCSQWLTDFDKFLYDMGPRPGGLTLDRKDNSKDYSPENCKWSTASEQQRNTRANIRLTIFGETKTLIEWANDRRCTVDYATLNKLS